MEKPLPTIDNHTVMTVVESIDIHVTGKIDGASLVYLESTGGNIVIDGKIDGGSEVTLKAAGNVSIGDAGTDFGEKKIDGSSNVRVIAGGSIQVGSRIDGSSVADFSAHGTITIGDRVDGSSTVRQIADGNILIKDKIDGSSRVELVSNTGSVTIGGKIDGSSKAWLTAATDVLIGAAGTDPENKKIDGNAFVSAWAGGLIFLGSRIAKDQTMVDFAACGPVTIQNGIGYGAHVRLLSVAGHITVNEPITDSGTSVISWPPNALTPNLQNGAQAMVQQWAPSEPLCLNAARKGSWWENWSQTFGYVAYPEKIVPHSLEDLVAAVAGATSPNARGEDVTPVKAVGGGWSFTDASLPVQQAADVTHVSIMEKGRPGFQDMHDVLWLSSSAAAVPMDLLPGAVTRNAAFSTAYDQTTLRQVTNSGPQLPSLQSNVRLIDTRALASSLQCDFPNIRSTAMASQIPTPLRATATVGHPTGMVGPRPEPRPGPRPEPEILFHVEAGITIADLQQLLDHQFPRLALRATGGSPGATLAGTMSTATHGGEFAWPLLIDSVRAIHLVGPGGEEWWIEGDVPVADPVKLQGRYPKLDSAHFIGGSWSGIPGLTAQDVLNAVTVSMGTMGVIYSVVLAVVPQYGIRQIVHSTTWTDLLDAAQVTLDELHAGDAGANTRLLDLLMDGQKNGTGIAKADNRYIDLAINPINADCWIVNRSETPQLPVEANASPIDYLTTLRLLVGKHRDVLGDKLIGRLFDFLHWQTDMPGFAANEILHHTAGKFMNFLMSQPDPLVAAVALGAVETVQSYDDPDSKITLTDGLSFFGDVLSGFFHALEGTLPGVNSDSTGVSSKVGAIGWPDAGIPGRGLEIALPPETAFTFLQTALFDDILTNTMRNQKKPLIGYISVRVCPTTKTLMGMQQYSPQSVMIEVVAYRSPEANIVMDRIQQAALALNGSGPKPMLHWGLENQFVTGAYLATTPLGQPYKGTLTKLDAFRAVRNYLRNGHAPVFDNAFTNRMGL